VTAMSYPAPQGQHALAARLATSARVHAAAHSVRVHSPAASPDPCSFPSPSSPTWLRADYARRSGFAHRECVPTESWTAAETANPWNGLRSDASDASVDASVREDSSVANDARCVPRPSPPPPPCARAFPARALPGTCTGDR
jgi:hypothetical protein